MTGFGFFFFNSQLPPLSFSVPHLQLLGEHVTWILQVCEHDIELDKVESLIQLSAAGTKNRLDPRMASSMMIYSRNRHPV